MSVYKREGRWEYRRRVRVLGGKSTRISGTPARYGLPNTRAAAVEAESRHTHEVATGQRQTPVPVEASASPTVQAFSARLIESSEARDKPSSTDSKRQILRSHILPAIGTLRLDEVTFAVIEDLKHALARRLSAKTVNNVLTVLRRMLVLAQKRGELAEVPPIEWMARERAGFDFLDFAEADRLLAAARPEPEWHAMILMGARTGLRQGEILGLQWDDIDHVARKLTVRRARVRGRIGTPKSGKEREIDLVPDLVAALKSHRHLRGPYVFCGAAGEPLTKGECKHPLWRACRRAGLRRIGWHVLRHTFASHLAMGGAPLRVIQELMGHSTIAMTERYSHLSPQVARAAAQYLERGQNVANAETHGDSRPHRTSQPPRRIR